MFLGSGEVLRRISYTSYTRASSSRDLGMRLAPGESCFFKESSLCFSMFFEIFNKVNLNPLGSIGYSHKIPNPPKKIPKLFI